MTEAKPPYRVPSMGEIAALPWNGLTVASTFSGCGGSSLGYRMAGFRVLYANEFVAAARDTYAANAAPYTVLDPRDIRTLQPADVLAALQLPAGELDVLDGSPPCASFSTAGKRQKDWGKVKTYSETAQRTDDLFFEFARILRGVQPRVFIAENVSGLVKGVAKGYFLDILWKAEQGYTHEQIARKRLALEGVLVPVTARWNEELLTAAGFRSVECVWRALNFAAWVAVL
jgi:DNA (cytosine-5)-methyltransferase 1